MQSSDGNAAVEFHDSELLRVSRDGAECVLELDGYLHRSLGTPGVSPGTGWSQTVLVRLTGVLVLEGVPELPITLSGGTLRAGDLEMTNVVPVPSSFTGPVHLELLGFNTELITVRAHSVQLTIAGEALYLEVFP